jgi:hypothetical protein
MPRNPSDPLQYFVRLRTSLERERASLTRRLAEIERALGMVNTGTPTGASVPAAPRRGRPPGSTNKPKLTGGTIKNKMTMREAVAKALSDGPLRFREIVPAMQRAGYKFASRNPVKAAGKFLYGPAGKKHFKRSADGAFSPK